MARTKGALNKTTKDVREVIARVAQRNAVKLEEWLDRVAIDDPAKAADLFLKAIEYHIPKLGRTEHTGQDGGAIVVDQSLTVHGISSKD